MAHPLLRLFEQAPQEITLLEKASSRQQRYQNQEELLRVTGHSGEYGLCSPLSNMTAEKAITGDKRYDVTHMSNSQAYQSATDYEREQVELYKKGKDAAHAAFVRTNTPYQVTEIPVSEAKKRLTVAELTGQKQDNQHLLITLPAKEGDETSHQVYLRYLGNGDCVGFDPNNDGGEKKAPCHQLVKQFFGALSSCEPDDKVTIAHGQVESRASRQVGPG